MKALVLGGGGSKGAYEIGVWKALNELDMKFDLVCGTSIGAMIGVLYVQQDYEKALKLWNELKVEDVMANGVDLDFDIELLMSQKGKYKAFLESYVHHKGADISPFEEMVEHLFDEERFFSSPIDYACMTVNVSKLKAQPMKKSEMSRELAKHYVIASASCYPAFPMKLIEGEKFIDGGYADNVPITLAREMGADEIVAVDLKSVGRLVVKTPEQGLTYIEPMVPLGSFLLFDHDRIARNMELGYLDTMKKFHKYAGGIYTFPLEDEQKIEALEDTLEEGYQSLKDFIDTQDMSVISEKITTHQLVSGLQTYQPFDHPFLAILESIALAFDFDVLQIYDFEQFVCDIKQVADAYAPTLQFALHDVQSMKQTLSTLKEAKAAEMICFHYYYMLRENINLTMFHMMATVANDSFIMAYALYLLHQDQTYEVR